MRKIMKHAVLAAACMAAFPAYATNGYFLPGFGFRSQGMGGVGIAYGRDSLSVAANPANAVNTGMRGDMGFGIFNPERYAAVGTPAGDTTFFGFNGSSESDLQYFVVPEMGFTMPLTEQLHLGVAVVGNGGMNTNYSTNFFQNNSTYQLGVDLLQLLVPVTLAYKLNDDHAFGASVVLAETRFRAYGIQSFAAISADPANLTNNGYDYSYGAALRLGWLGEFLDDKLTLGLTYATKSYMTKFDKYRGLFAEQGGFDIPSNYGIGIALKPAKNLVIAADVLRIEYEGVAAVSNRGPGFDSGPGFQGIAAGFPCGNLGDAALCLGEDRGLGFGWVNQTVYKLGVQYGVNNRLQLRAGYNYGKSPILDDQLTFNTLAPATVEHHYSVGFTYKASDTLEVSGTYMYAAPNSQVARDQNIVGGVEIGMHQNLFGISLGWVLEPGKDDYGDVEIDPYDFSGFYIGMGFGQSNHVDMNGDIAESAAALGGGTANTTAVNKRSEGWKVFTGYQLTPNFGIEGGYVNLNDATATTLVTAPAPAVGRINTKVAADTWFLGGTGTLPVTDNIDVFGKVGAHFWSVHPSIGSTSSIVPSLNTSDDGIDLYYGVGVSYTLIEGLDLRAEWERYAIDSDYDVDLVTAGFAVRF